MIVLLLGVKEDPSIFVVFLGIYLLSRREIRHGVAPVAIGIAWYELTTRAVIPHFAGGTPYTDWTYGRRGQDLPDALRALVRTPWKLFTVGSRRLRRRARSWSSWPRSCSSALRAARGTEARCDQALRAKR